MSEAWIVNASPLICLAKAGSLQLLSRLAGTLVVSQEVVDEVLAGPSLDPARRELEAGFGTRVPRKQIVAAVQAWGLGAGESAVLSLASTTPASIAVLDDAQARMCGLFLKVQVVGSLGVVLRARRAGLIDRAAPVIRQLVTAGFWIDERTIGEALRRTVGEDWP